MAGVRLEWAQFGDFDSFDVIRSDSPMDVESLPSPIVTGLTTMYYVDTSVVAGTRYYYRIVCVKDSNRQVSSEVSLFAGFNGLSNFLSGEIGLLYDPSDFSTMFQDDAGTIPVTAIGQSVGKILDKSGNDNHAYQSNSAKKPILGQDSFEKYKIEFDGIDDFLTIPTLNMGSTDKFTVHIGLNHLANGMIMESSISASNYPVNNGAFFIHAGVDVGNTGYESFSAGTTGGASTEVVLGTFTPPDLAVLTFTHSIPDSLSTARRNQISGANATGYKGTGNFLNYQAWIGCRAGNAFFCKMDLYSLIIRGVISDASMIENNENWINAKAGAF